jgi:hypothetical protein
MRAGPCDNPAEPPPFPAAAGRPVARIRQVAILVIVAA